MQGIVISLVAAVACRFMQDRHASRYLGSKRVTILVSATRVLAYGSHEAFALTICWVCSSSGTLSL
jgi:hypothetical protein